MGSSETPAKNLAITPSLAQELRSLVKVSRVLTPDSEGYAESLKRWSGASEKPAGAVLLANSEQDISAAVVLAAKHHIDLAVKGGGHSTSGSSSSNGGLVIDQSLMRHATVNLEKKTITCQGGAVWTDVDEAAAEYGMATPGGTVNHTGVGGLALGGGYGYLTSLYGMVIDNMVSARVVLANGDIVNASEKENPDLFWALRGAGHNFGVVVEFEFKLYEQGDVWCGILGFTTDKVEPVLNFMNAHAETRDPLSPAFLFLTCAPGTKMPIFAAMVFYNGSEEAGKEKFKPLLDIGPIFNATKPCPYKDANAQHNDGSKHGPRRRVRGGSFELPMSVQFVENCLENFRQMVTEVPDASGTLLGWELFDQTKINEIDISATAFGNRGSHHNCTIGMGWTDPKNDEMCKKWAHFFGKLFADELKRSSSSMESKGGATPIYVNNIEPGEMEPKDIYGVNYEKLQRIKGKYDPEEVFAKTHPIEPVFA